jgi:hypothetical protein
VREEWTDAEIRGFMVRIAMERRRAERRALTKQNAPTQDQKLSPPTDDDRYQDAARRLKAETANVGQ